LDGVDHDEQVDDVLGQAPTVLAGPDPLLQVTDPHVGTGGHGRLDEPVDLQTPVLPQYEHLAHGGDPQGFGQAVEYRKVALGHALVPVEAVVLGLLHRCEHGVEFRASQRCLADGDSGQVGVFGVEVVQEFGGDPFQGGGELAARFQGDAQPLGQWFDVGVGGGSVVGAVPVDLHQPVGAAQ